MKHLSTWAAAVALAAAVGTTSSAFGQADLQLRQAREAEAQQKKEQRQERKAETATDRQERQREKKEREQLNNMPNPVKRVLRTETENANNVDYFRIPKQAGQEHPTFGATFTKADGHHYDIRVDRDGNVLSRTDLTAQQTAAAAPATPAPATPAPATPAPATPAPGTPAPAPTSPSASAGTPSQEAPEAGSPVYRRLQPTEVPANIKTVLDREAKGGKDVKYYRSKYGHEMAYTVSFDDANGHEQSVHVGDNGQVLARGGKAVGEAQTASSSSSSGSKTGSNTGSNSTSNTSASQAPGRVELTAMPKQAQTQLRRLTEGASDVKFYRTKYGNEQAYQANYTTKDGKEHRVFVDDNGKILSQKDEGSTSNSKTNTK